MKKLLLSVFVACAAITSSALADLIYIRDAGIAFDRSRLLLVFRDAPGSGKDLIEVRLASSDSDALLRYAIVPIRDKHREATVIATFLEILNNPATSQIDIQESIENAGWKLR